MRALKISLRLAKFLWKLILGLLLVLIAAVAIVHLPPVQKQITRAVSDYLSSRIEAKVYIERIDFSILGHIILKDLTVWSRDGSPILSIHELEVSSSIFDLVTGDLIFDSIRITGLKGQLTQDKDGLNIQFILDAFQTDDTQTAEPTAVKLQFKNVQLEDIDFEFKSTSNGITVANRVGMLIIQDGKYSTEPTTITAAKVVLQQTNVDILSLSFPDTTHNSSAAITDSSASRSGIVITVMDLEVDESNFSFHQNEVFNTPKFDPAHLTIQDIQISLSDIYVGVRKDTVGTILKSVSARLPGITLSNSTATNLQWTPSRLVASDFHLATQASELDVDFKGWHDSKPASTSDGEHLEIDASGKINPKDLSYFLSDSIMQYFSHWPTTDLKVTGHYDHKKGEIKTLNLKTGNSHLEASGKIGEVLNFDKIYWNDLAVNTTIGSDFKKTFAPFVSDINVPPNIIVQLKSAGSLKNALIDGKVLSPWGDVKADGTAMQQGDNFAIDLNLTGQQVDLGQWVNVSELGPMNFSLNANGFIGKETNVEVDGTINDMEIVDQSIRNIALQSTIDESTAVVNLHTNDPKYKSKIHSEIAFAKPQTLASDVTLDNFQIGNLLHLDSTLFISGDLKSKMTIDQSSLEGYVEGDTLLIQNQSVKYVLDSMTFYARLSPAASHFEYYSDHENGNVTSNFDIRNSPELIRSRLVSILKGQDHISPTGNRNIQINATLENPELLQLVGIDIDNFTALRVRGEIDEQKQTTSLKARAEAFTGYGISLDTLTADLMAIDDSVNATLAVTKLIYNSVQLGDLNFDILTKGDTARSNLQLSNDTTTILGLQTRIVPTDSGTLLYPDKLRALSFNYSVDSKNPVFVNHDNIAFHQFQIKREDMHMTLDGDFNKFNLSLGHVNLTPLNFLLSSDTTIINDGYLSGEISYALREQHLNLHARVDSLRIYNSTTLTLAATAVSEGSQVPFEFLLTNSSNKIDLKGRYNFDNTEVKADLLLTVNNPELFDFLVSDVVDDMTGTITSETQITGPIRKPAFKGHVRFQDVEFSTVNPRIPFKIEDDNIALDNSSLVFNQFTLYDSKHHPLQVDGKVTTKDYQSISYDLHLKGEDYTLLDRPDSSSAQVKGTLILDSDINLKGNEKDTYVDARLTIKDETRFTFVNASDDIELLKTDGIIEFIDPAMLSDSTLEQSGTFYDSLIASLPDFNLNSTVTVEDDAAIRIIIDEQSGDYIEASGGARLEMNYDRTGNLRLSGDYTVKQGVYRLSFYDLVKRNFALAPGSSIHWSGSPEDGNLNIKAVHTVQSNSLGLIGHEIGENEKSIYKRSLNYEVGINIGGTLGKPIVSFSLDLPAEEKANYPVLANKLDRLRQPEFGSELNKQVFGLLVLGGFLPETSTSDINSGVIATTALSNSVNALLASQLNRFASQYIKGVNIDVGIQSYSDYSAPGGKTQTAMDFRVSKRIMDDRLSFEVGGDFDINQDQSGANTGKNYRGDIAIIYDLTGNGDKQLKLFNNETYDIVYQEIRNTGISLIFVREFAPNEKKKRKKK